MIPFEPFDKIIGAFLGVGFGDLSGEFFEVKQVHGDGVVVIKSSADAARYMHAEADAVICSQWGVPIAVRTADCVPVLIAHPNRVIAVVHAGWRGTSLAILEKTLLRMREQFGLDLSEVELAIGPAIGSECYEIGREVAEIFLKGEGSAHVKAAANGKYLLDLKAINEVQARSLGVRASSIERRPECTRCLSEDFHSHRAAMARGDAKAGRNYSWLMISP